MSYFNPIYEIRLAGRDVKIDMACWDIIRDHVRSNKWFYVEYLGTIYRYVKDHEFLDRPARFDFEIKDEDWDDTPEIIRVYPRSQW